MKTKFKALIFTTLLICSTLNAQNFEWVKNIRSVGTDVGIGIKVDNSGNIYTVGHFNANCDFNPDTGVFNLSPLGFYDVYISKLDASGNFIWAKQIGGSNDERATSIFIDNFGDLYVTGYFKGTVDFDPDTSVFNIISFGNYDAFICKLDSSGNFIWAKNYGGTSDEYLYSVVVDDAKNTYTTGTFEATSDFDPGTSTYNLTSLNSVVMDIFVSKLDSLGNFVWAKQIGGFAGKGSSSIALDNNNNVYTTGYFGGTVDFDPSLATFDLTTSGLEDIFISKLDKDGNFVWAKIMGGSIGYDRGASITVDDLGFVYTTGYFDQSGDFDPGPGIYNLTNFPFGLFVSKLDSFGNFVWAKKFAGTNGGRSNTIALDNVGDVYTSGYFEGTMDFDPGLGTYNLTELGSDDMFICKLDSSGNFVWANQISGSSGSEIGKSITIDNSGSVFTTGDFSVNASGTVDFDPGVSTFNQTALGSTDIFVHKISQCINSFHSFSETVCNSYVSPSGNYIWSSTGIYYDTLPNYCGNDSIIIINLTVNPPVNNASYTYLDNSNSNYSFTNTSTGSYNKTHWAFGDGTTSTAANPNHTFSANGTYVVVLTVKDSTIGSSCIDYYLDTITVTGVVAPLQCAAGFVMYPDAGNVTVVNSSAGSNLTYLWDFGDGTTSTQQYPTHTYATSGNFYLCLTIDDGAGCVNMYCDSIGENGVVFNKQTGFTINVIAPPLATQVNEQTMLTSGVTIYPNPTTAEFVIELPNNSVGTPQLSIVSVEGKTVYTNNSINTNKIVVNAANWSKGIYVVKITDEKSTQVIKLVKE